MVCVWGVWWHLPAAMILTVFAIVAHEMAHYVAMWPVAEDVRLKISNVWLWNVQVESEILNERWRHRWADLAGLTPALCGLAIITVWWQLGAWPPLNTMLGWAQWHALAWFAVLGGLDDYSRGHSVQTDTDSSSDDLPPVARVMSDGGQQMVKQEQRLLTVVMVGLLSAGVGLLYHTACIGAIRPVGYWLGVVAMALSLSSMLVLARRMGEYEIDWN